MIATYFDSDETWYEHKIGDMKYYDHSPFINFGPTPKWFLYILIAASDVVALFFGFVAQDYYLNPSGTADWVFGSFFLAVVAGLIFRFLFKDDFGGHIGITKASVIVALIIAIITLIVMGTEPPIFVYLVLFTYAICL